MKNNGIFCDYMIAELASAQNINSHYPFADGQIQPASLDLRLGFRCWRMRASFLPGKRKSIEEQISAYSLHEIDLSKGAVLETGCVYLAEIMEEFSLPKEISATTNPKSSTGRLDVFTRIITEGGNSFDHIPAGYNGRIFAEISPRTFPILVRTGSRLAQIRFRKGECRIPDDLLIELHKTSKIVQQEQAIVNDGLVLSIDLLGLKTDGLIGYRAKKHAGLIDVDLVDAYSAPDYWEPIYSAKRDQKKGGELILDPNEFYILASLEEVNIPSDYAAEMVPFDPLMGEFRVHYAGFFDPGFGNRSENGKGARAVLEVRSRDVPFLVEHEQTIGRLIYEKMADAPQKLYGGGLLSNYQGQGLKLSKHFKT